MTPPTLTEEIALGRDRDLAGAAVAAEVEPAHDRHGDPVELARDELRRARELVGDGDDGRAQLVSHRIALPLQILEHDEAGRPDRDVDRALAPGAPEGVRHDHAHLAAATRTERVAEGRR